MIQLNDVELYLPNYEDIWFYNCDARYRVLKGARETGKTYNFIGLEVLFKILSDPRRNIMLIRQNDKDNAQSNFTILKMLIKKLGLSSIFRCYVTPHKIVRLDTNQVILFGGMNDVENITSTSVESGYWTDIYFEEASQLKSYEEFRVVDGSLRVPEYENDLKEQITFLMNGWDVGHWIYDVFFKDRLEDNVETLETKGYQYYFDRDFNIGNGYGLALHISSYKCNPYIRKDRIDAKEKLKNINYDVYKVEVLGCWGNTSDVTYSYFTDKLIKEAYEIDCLTFNSIVIGVDFGMSNGEGKIKYSIDNSARLGSANTMQLVGITNNYNTLVSMDEYFDTNIGRSDSEKKKSPQIQHEMAVKIKEWINRYRLDNESIMCFVDCADSGGFIDGLELECRRNGVYNVVFQKATKIPILTRIYFEDLFFSYGDIIISKRCSNLIREIRNARKSKEGKPREDYDDHALNAWEYAWIPNRKRLKNWRDIKEL